MSKTELEGINAKQQMVELIRQNFNHPSILFWGIQNEIQISGERPELRKLVNELNELTKKEDPTRLTTMANVMFVEDEDDYNYVTDTIGYNKYFGWYNGEAGDFAGWLDGFHKKNPTVKLAISEYGAEGILQYHSSEPKIKDYSEEYHALYHETVWKIFEKRPFLWATYAWNMFDFGANIRDEGGVQGRNNKGLSSPMIERLRRMLFICIRHIGVMKNLCILQANVLSIGRMIRSISKSILTVMK